MITFYLDSKSEDVRCPEILFRGTNVSIYRNLHRKIINVGIHGMAFEISGGNKFYTTIMNMLPKENNRKMMGRHNWNDYKDAPEKMKQEVEKYSNSISEYVLQSLGNALKKNPNRILWLLKGCSSVAAESALRQVIHTVHEENHKQLKKLSQQANALTKW